jgi:secondary thiamine-phosphate synthase enzyme
MVIQETIEVITSGRETINLTQQVQQIVANSDVQIGTCNVFVAHTSASLILCENADPDVRYDLETFMTDLVRDGDPKFRHHDEGPDDMSAHIRTVLTNPDVTMPVTQGRCALGIWQGLYLWEHRTHRQHRKIIVTVSGDK